MIQLVPSSSVSALPSMALIRDWLGQPGRGLPTEALLFNEAWIGKQENEKFLLPLHRPT